MRNGMKDLEMGDLTVQIRIEFSTYGTLQGKETSQVVFRAQQPPWRVRTSCNLSFASGYVFAGIYLQWVKDPVPEIEGLLD